MAAKKTDRRVRRTRELLQNALEELILEKGFERVTVQDILDRADVGRSTFYAHFRDKEELLLSGFERFHVPLDGSDPAEERTPSGHLARFSLELFIHAEESRRFFKAMLGRQSGDFLLRHAQERFSAVARTILTGLQPDESRWTTRPDVVVQYVATSLLSTLVWWLDSDAPITATEMDAMYRRLTLPGIATALGLPLSEVEG